MPAIMQQVQAVAARCRPRAALPGAAGALPAAARRRAAGLPAGALPGARRAPLPGCRGCAAGRCGCPAGCRGCTAGCRGCPCRAPPGRSCPGAAGAAATAPLHSPRSTAGLKPRGSCHLTTPQSRDWTHPGPATNPLRCRRTGVWREFWLAYTRVASYETLDTHVTSADAVPQSSADDAAHRRRGDRRHRRVADEPTRAAQRPGGTTASRHPTVRAATRRSRRRRHRPRTHPRHPVLVGRDDRRRGRHLHPGAGQTARRVVGALVSDRVRNGGTRFGRPDRARRGAARHRPGVRRQHHDRADRGHPPDECAGDPGVPERPAPSGEGLGYRPATTEQPFGQNISAILISPPQAPPGKQWTPPAGVAMPGQAPAIISRAEWGADESLRCGKPQYDNGIRAGVVHHTAGSNDYSPLESAGIVKAIYTYHSKTLGWCDIAYNALVDKYGQVFEGAPGGLTKPVEGLPHRRIQPRNLGCGHDRQLRRRAADTDPDSDGRPAAGLAAGHGRRRPQGHGRRWCRRVATTPPFRPAPPRHCPPSSPIATSETPTARATPPTR